MVYWVIMYGEESLNLSGIRVWRISIYVSELLVGTIIIFMSYKNLENDNSRDSTVVVRSS